MKVIVIGSGIIGASVAFRLAQGGADVTVVEERRVGGGTSSVTYAWVNACEKLDSKPYFDLNFAGRAAHQRIADELGGHDWYPRPGLFQWQDANSEAGGVDRQSQTEKYEILRDWGYPAKLVRPEDVAALEPEITPEAFGNRPILHYYEDGWCHAVLYSGRVMGAAIHRHGTRLVQGRVEEVMTAGGVCTGVRLGDGTEIQGDVVVNCAGKWANDFLDPADRMPLAPNAGLVVYTMPAGLQLTHGLRTPEVNLRPDGAGRLLLRAGDIDKHIDGHAPATAAQEHADELVARARRLLPALADVPMEASRIAIRPRPADGVSIVGPAPGIEGLYLIVTHSGVTLGPALGEMVADELLKGTTRSELDHFRPARFGEGVSA